MYLSENLSGATLFKCLRVRGRMFLPGRGLNWSFTPAVVNKSMYFLPALHLLSVVKCRIWKPPVCLCVPLFYKQNKRGRVFYFLIYFLAEASVHLNIYVKHEEVWYKFKGAQRVAVCFDTFLLLVTLID